MFPTQALLVPSTLLFVLACFNRNFLICITITSCLLISCFTSCFYIGWICFNLLTDHEETKNLHHQQSFDSESTIEETRSSNIPARRSKRLKTKPGECCCCYDMIVYKNLVMCPNGHSICNVCISKQTMFEYENAQVQGSQYFKGSLKCPGPNCSTGTFDSYTLGRVLTSHSQKLYDRMVRNYNEELRYQKNSEKTPNTINSNQLSRLFPVSYMCGRCQFGPVVHRGCNDLSGVALNGRLYVEC
jgi:hypothetical protein